MEIYCTSVLLYLSICIIRVDGNASPSEINYLYYRPALAPLLCEVASHVKTTAIPANIIIILG